MKAVKNKAFTLIELLIAIGIVLILLTVGLANYEIFDRHNNLILTADSLKAFILAAKDDARGHSSDFAVGSQFTKIVIKIDPANVRELNEYRYISDSEPYPNATIPKIFNSFTLSSKIDLQNNELAVSAGDELISIDIPSGKYLPGSATEIKFISGSDSVILNINENSITTTRSF